MKREKPAIGRSRVLSVAPLEEADCVGQCNFLWADPACFLISGSHPWLGLARSEAQKTATVVLRISTCRFKESNSSNTQQRSYISYRSRKVKLRVDLPWCTKQETHIGLRKANNSPCVLISPHRRRLGWPENSLLEGTIQSGQQQREALIINSTLWIITLI